MSILVKNLLYAVFMLGFISFFVFIYVVIRKNEKTYDNDKPRHLAKKHNGPKL